MRRHRWEILLGLALAGVSAALYLALYMVSGNARGVIEGLLGNLAFLPVYVLLATLIIDGLLRVRERELLLNKLNMVIGVFFSEAGTRLLKSFAGFDPDAEALGAALRDGREWSGEDFARILRLLEKHPYRVDGRRGDLPGLRAFLLAERPFLMDLLANPGLLEHEAFTDLLWAVLHLTEELAHRPANLDPGPADAEHLSGDIARAYRLLVAGWLAYLRHLKEDYPYLFSLALRTHPFDPKASPEIR